MPNFLGPNFDMLYDCPEPELSQFEGMPCMQFSETSVEFHWLSAAPRSRHTGGVNVAFIDGRVGFLSDEVDPFTMAYLVSIDHRQVIDPEDAVP